jgi:hypothetical protein
MAFSAVPHRRAGGGEYHSIYSGAVLNFVENRTRCRKTCAIAPTVFTGAASLGKVYSGVLIGPKQAGALQQWAYKLAATATGGPCCARRANRPRLARSCL